eukprot:5355434-Prymnesium_polylepis.1
MLSKVVRLHASHVLYAEIADLDRRRPLSTVPLTEEHCPRDAGTGIADYLAYALAWLAYG